MFNTGSLLLNGKYSDLTIVCHGESIAVHKAVLCAASPVFAKACDLDMQEKRTGVVNQDGFDIESMRRMLNFAYNETYTVTVDQSPTAGPQAATRIGGEQVVAAESTTAAAEKAVEGDLGGLSISEDPPDELPVQLLEHVRVYAIAEYYAFAQLKLFAADRFVELFRKCGRQDGRAPYQIDRVNGARLCRDWEFYAKLARVDGVQGFAAEMLQQVAIHAGFHAQSDLAKKIELSCEIERLRASEESLRDELGSTKDNLAHVQSMMGNLILDLGNLPTVCKKEGCKSVFGPLVFDRKTDAKYGQGDWLIKCGKTSGNRDWITCSAQLN